MERLANCISSWKVEPSLPTPMDRVADQAAGVDHLVDGVQDVELLVHKPGQVLLLEQEQVTVPLHSAEHAPGARHPGIQPGVTSA